MSSSIFLMIFIAFITVLLFFSLMNKKMKYMNTNKLPPGPTKLPIIGNLHQLGGLPHRSLKKLSKTYGDLMFLKLGSVPTIIVSSADMTREIIKKHDLVFSGRSPIYAAKKFAYNYTSISLAPYGEYWREIRKIAVLELMTHKKVQTFHKIREEEVTHMVDCITQNAQQVIDMNALMFSLSNNVICRAAFGENYGNKKFQDILIEIQHLSGDFNIADYLPWLAWINKFNGIDKRLEENFQNLDEFFEKVLGGHHDPSKPKPDQEDIVDVLLRIQKDPDQPITLTNDHIKAILFDIFIGGIDSSSATLVWTMTELMRNRQVRERAEREVRRLVKGKQSVEEEDLQELTYIKLVIKESLRLHPPSPLMLPRETTENCVIANKYEIPVKTKVIFNAWAIATDPMHWESPEIFWPERFLNNDIDFRGQHFELLPFGVGRRGCPGINFAVPLVELALANLLLLFDWELPSGMSGEDLDINEALGITMQKKIPLCLVATPAPV